MFDRLCYLVLFGQFKNCENAYRRLLLLLKLQALAYIEKMYIKKSIRRITCSKPISTPKPNPIPKKRTPKHAIRPAYQDQDLPPFNKIIR